MARINYAGREEAGRLFVYHAQELTFEADTKLLHGVADTLQVGGSTFLPSGDAARAA